MGFSARNTAGHGETLDGERAVPVDRPIRVLVVDDSAIVRKILTDCLAAEPDIQVVGTAPDAFVARDKILALEPDVITLDIEMPRMDGLTFLKKLMQFHPIPTIVISSLTQQSCRTALEALALGAVEALAKPGGPYSAGNLRHLLADKIRAAARARIWPSAAGTTSAFCRNAAPAGPQPSLPRGAIIAIGASTGGTEAIAAILAQLPESTPGVAIVQHIPAEFSRAFAQRLNEHSAMEVREARDGDELRPGQALVAPGNLHMAVRRNGGGYAVSIQDGPRICYQRPSVDVLFASVAEIAGPLAVGVLLTGMGSDGARGLLKMRRAGARTFAQDEATSVVYGMPREAASLGAVERQVPLSRMADAILNARVGRSVPAA
jgi:two-component system chemotaxis response regulator CheB